MAEASEILESLSDIAGNIQSFDVKPEDMTLLASAVAFCAAPTVETGTVLVEQAATNDKIKQMAETLLPKALEAMKQKTGISPEMLEGMKGLAKGAIAFVPEGDVKTFLGEMVDQVDIAEGAVTPSSNATEAKKALAGPAMEEADKRALLFEKCQPTTNPEGEIIGFTQTVENGRVDYDADGEFKRVVEEVDGVKRTINNGKISISKKDENGNETSYSFDKNGILDQVTLQGETYDLTEETSLSKATLEKIEAEAKKEREEAEERLEAIRKRAAEALLPPEPPAGRFKEVEEVEEVNTDTQQPDLALSRISWMALFMNAENKSDDFALIPPDQIHGNTAVLQSGSKLTSNGGEIGLSHGKGAMKPEDAMTMVLLGKEQGWTSAEIDPETSPEFQAEMLIAMKRAGMKITNENVILDSLEKSGRLNKETWDRITQTQKEAAARDGAQDATFEPYQEIHDNFSILMNGVKKRGLNYQNASEHWDELKADITATRGNSGKTGSSNYNQEVSVSTEQYEKPIGPVQQAQPTEQYEKPIGPVQQAQPTEQYEKPIGPVQQNGEETKAGPKSLTEQLNESLNEQQVMTMGAYDPTQKSYGQHVLNLAAEYQHALQNPEENAEEKLDKVLKNLSSQFPDKATELAGKWEAIAERGGEGSDFERMKALGETLLSIQEDKVAAHRHGHDPIVGEKYETLENKAAKEALKGKTTSQAQTKKQNADAIVKRLNEARGK